MGLFGSRKLANDDRRLSGSSDSGRISGLPDNLRGANDFFFVGVVDTSVFSELCTAGIDVFVERIRRTGAGTSAEGGGDEGGRVPIIMLLLGRVFLRFILLGTGGGVLCGPSDVGGPAGGGPDGTGGPPDGVSDLMLGIVRFLCEVFGGKSFGKGGGATSGGGIDGGATVGGIDGGATVGGDIEGGATEGGNVDGGAVEGGNVDGGATEGGAIDPEAFGGGTIGVPDGGVEIDGGFSTGGRTCTSAGGFGSDFFSSCLSFVARDWTSVGGAGAF
eukprot:g1075.t1